MKQEFNEALMKINSDGTLVKLVKALIDEGYHNVQPAGKEMPSLPNAPTIKIGFTGDLPPFDIISAEGKPTGFNTIVLAEISNRIGKNFELVKIKNEERMDALVSHKVDVIFCKVILPENKFRPLDTDKPAEMILTEPYFSDKIVHVSLRK